uniref:Ubiquitin associated protein 1 n=1 Tax=Cynoglossus semilaevis TaxID=244447 RepID=A0A3P8W4M4_CYNSE
MAAGKSGSDAYNNGPISYLEDVPFKINEKFCCPAKVGLPVGFCLPDCRSLLINTEYDFSLERRSVQWGLELANAEKKAAMLEAEARDCSDQAQDNDGGGENTTMPATDNQDPPPPALNPVLVGLSHNAILTPLPAPSLGPRKTHKLPVPIPAFSENLSNGGLGSSSLPCGGALLSMTPNERQCVETLVGMGYSYEDVLRAMQRQGQNIEQVRFTQHRCWEIWVICVSHISCLVYCLCALQFLELMTRFGEMGFERDAIKEVLLVHNNDQEKALEDLMTRAAAS